MTAKELGNQAAFSCTTGTDGGIYTLGLTKREYAAIQIMAGIIAANPENVTGGQIAKAAVVSAEYLLEELTLKKYK